MATTSSAVPTLRTNLSEYAVTRAIRDGRVKSDLATLDFCGYDYTSEKLRAARVQVEYVNGSQDASNEFVQYKPGGATTAYSQIQKAVSGCPSTYTDSNGTLSQVRPITSAPGFAKEHLAITFALTGTGLDGSPVTQWSAVVYQFDGDYFSGVYVYGSSRAQVQQLAVTLAARAAQHLAEAVAGKPGTGGGTFTDPGDTQGPGAPA